MSKSNKKTRAGNTYRDQLVVLLEDNANSRILNGFLMDPSLSEKVIIPLSVEGGWEKVPKTFLKDYVNSMRRYPNRRILFLLDFDRWKNRREYIGAEMIPEDLKERVFMLGSASNPEKLKKNFPKPNSFEAIGKALAQDCFDGTDHAWGHELLIHNEKELARMEKSVKPFLFPTTSNP